MPVISGPTVASDPTFVISNAPIAIEWDFGDGSPVSNEIAPKHVFPRVKPADFGSMGIDQHGNRAVFYEVILTAGYSYAPIGVFFEQSFYDVIIPLEIAGLRQRQRDDGLNDTAPRVASAGANTPTSVQKSLRRGSRNTYL